MPDARIQLKAAAEIIVKNFADLNPREVNIERLRLEQFAKDEGGDPTFVMACFIAKILSVYNEAVKASKVVI